MIKINRLLLMKIHLILATFIFPVALMFLITGALYTVGIEGSYDTQVYTLKLDAPLQKDDAALTDFVTQELQKLNLSPPTGTANIESTDKSIKVDWRGAALRVTLESTQQTEAKLTVKEANWHQKLLELHKANGANAFKVYAVIWATILLMLLITGFIMALQLPKYRKMTIYSTISGIVVFIVMVISG
ncbi:MAG: PepSY-associated TM helix domain-containing protein [Methylococcaceae bacterium]|nr:PepSY-associated TM helix domain-containing protein [Methylococcaceae bacterium]